jgi:hypothetical protein
MKLLRKWIRLTTMWIAPALLLVLVVGVLWGIGHPWPPAEPTLRAFAGHTPLLVGFTEDYSYVSSSSGEDRTQSASRTYLLIPSEAAWPKVITVSRTNDDAPQVSEESAVWFLVSLAALIAVSAIAWSLRLHRARTNAA